MLQSDDILIIIIINNKIIIVIISISNMNLIGATYIRASKFHHMLHSWVGQI